MEQSIVLTFFSLKSVTESFASLIHGLKVDHLTDGVIRRSKRMILDSLGVGFLGTGTEVFHKVTQYSEVRSPKFSFKIKTSMCTNMLQRSLCLCSAHPTLSLIAFDVYSIVLCVFMSPLLRPMIFVVRSYPLLIDHAS